MNAKALFPLTVAALVAASVSAVSLSKDGNPSAPAEAPVAARIVDLPTVTVRPSAEDRAYYQANRIVELATVTVRPDPQDRAHFLTSSSVRTVDFPVVTVRPSADVEVAVAGAISLVRQIAAR